MSLKEREGLIEKYTKYALTPEQDLLDSSYGTLVSSLNLPEDIYAAVCGGGCPLALYDQSLEGKTVCDLGCGAGHDVVIAASLTKASGKVFGVDCTQAMLDRAVQNADRAGVSSRVHFIQANFDTLGKDQLPEPLHENMADLVISNGSINLAFDKPAAFDTAYRLAAPGARFCFTDLVVDAAAPAEEQCVAGGGASTDAAGAEAAPSVAVTTCSSFQGGGWGD
jgi:SAM-dependent methyltransferase